MRVPTDSRLDADASARRWPDTAPAGYISVEQPAPDQESGLPVIRPESNRRI